MLKIYTTGAHSFTRARGFRAGEQMAAIIGPVDAVCLRTSSYTLLDTNVTNTTRFSARVFPRGY